MLFIGEFINYLVEECNFWNNENNVDIFNFLLKILYQFSKFVKEIIWIHVFFMFISWTENENGKHEKETTPYFTFCVFSMDFCA
jgi:hypothetical protein